MITMAAFWMGRDVRYASEFNSEIESNGNRTVAYANALIDEFERETGIILERVASGWRPRGVNAKTANAGKKSNHIAALAIDIEDTKNRDFARWCAKNPDRLAAHGLYCERLEWTPTWVHLSPVPPASGKRFYIPSTAPALCKRLPEQIEGIS